MRPFTRLLFPLIVAVAPSLAAQSAQSAHTAADVAFMRGMLQHHAQAIVMTDLVPARTTRPELRALAERIAVGQQGEMGMMTVWLAKRGERAADSAGAAGAGHAAHGAPGGHAAMPGMLTAAELDSMRVAKGVEFERRFLAGMIRHHEGAIAMVAELLRTPGAARDPQLYQFANDVDADQRAEIARMRRLLLALPQ